MSGEDGTADDPDAADETPSAPDEEADARTTPDHLEGVPDGCGCAEIWEHLAERRSEGD